MEDKLYEALERFSIMSENVDTSEKDAIAYVAKKYGRKIAEEVWNKYATRGGK